jgi:hypothetical protein
MLQKLTRRFFTSERCKAESGQTVIDAMSVSLGFVAFPTELNTLGEAGLCNLVMVNADSVLPFPPVTVSFLVSLGKN